MTRYWEERLATKGKFTPRMARQERARWARPDWVQEMSLFDMMIKAYSKYKNKGNDEYASMASEVGNDVYEKVIYKYFPGQLGLECGIEVHPLIIYATGDGRLRDAADTAWMLLSRDVPLGYDYDIMADITDGKTLAKGLKHHNMTDIDGNIWAI